MPARGDVAATPADKNYRRLPLSPTESRVFRLTYSVPL
jgi:hypothetical protein